MSNIELSYWIIGLTPHYSAYAPDEFCVITSPAEQIERKRMLGIALHKPENLKEILFFSRKYNVDYIILSNKEKKAWDYYKNETEHFKIVQLQNFLVIKIINKDKEKQ